METSSKTFIKLTEEYLHFCTARKNLDTKTIKSYSIDLKQFAVFLSDYSLESMLFNSSNGMSCLFAYCSA